MQNRIAFIRKNAGLNQADFAKRLNLTKNYISLIETGNRTPGDRTIVDICREFGVDRIWLETGAGEPFRPMSRNEEIAEILGKAIAGNDTARDRLIRAFCKIPDELFPEAERILNEIVENLKKESQ